jgi:phosphatidylglycerol:prolipoprotein diacylglycerol transferase
MHPWIFQIGGFKLATYGVLAACGYMAALLYARRNARLSGFDPEKFWDLAAVLIIGALLGGKMAYAAIFWDGFGGSFSERLLNMVRDLRSGFVFMGGLAGAAFSGGAYLYCRRISLPDTADMVAPAVALGHAIGRLGCFFAGCCYGLPTASFWGVRFTDPGCLVPNGLLGIQLHPVQLYESAGNLALFGLLDFLFRRRNRLPRGAVFLAYAAGYSALRFALEFFRGDERGGFFLRLSPSQLAGIAIISVCAVLYAKLPARETQ